MGRQTRITEESERNRCAKGNSKMNEKRRHTITLFACKLFARVSFRCSLFVIILLGVPFHKFIPHSTKFETKQSRIDLY